MKKEEQEARRITLDYRSHSDSFTVVPCLYDENKRFRGKKGFEAWHLSSDRNHGRPNGVFIVHCDRNYHIVEAAMEWNHDFGLHFPNTGKHSFRNALRYALGRVTLPGSWYITDRIYRGSDYHTESGSGARLRRRYEQEALSDFIQDIQVVMGS
jgi:hypothetical protein